MRLESFKRPVYKAMMGNLWTVFWPHAQARQVILVYDERAHAWNAAVSESRNEGACVASLKWNVYIRCFAYSRAWLYYIYDSVEAKFCISRKKVDARAG